MVDLVVYDDEDQRYVPWKVSIVAVVLAGLLAAGITLFFAPSPQPEQVGGLSAPQETRSPEEGSPSASAPSAAIPPPSAAPPEVTIPPSPGAQADPTATPPAQAASAACTTALARADAVAQRSTAVEQALAEHTRIMEELLAQRLTAEQALDRALPVLTRGATERDRLEDELAAYQSSRAACAD